MAKKYKVGNFQGYQKIITNENSDLKLINLSFIKNIKDQNYNGTTNGEETVLILIEGSIILHLEGKLFAKISRENVFSQPPSAIYLPPYLKYSINFLDKTEICLASCVAKGIGQPKLIQSKNMVYSRVGKDGYSRNLVQIVDESFRSEKLIIGETIGDPGSWVSFPPHKHDTNNPPEEVAMEEVYYFKFSPKNGFGTIRIFDDLEDNVFVIRDNEIITIPKGYHPISVVPGHQIYYLWVMAGDTRKMASTVHPDFCLF
ncbi:5-deoxy-glucuronate isomerase [bacterium]|nr:5-deoxy-glucuronate isomerase [bacterium]